MWTRRQRHEFGDAAGFVLQTAQRQQVPRPMLGPLDMAVHDRRGRRQADQMRIAHHAQPFGGGLLVGADLAADIVAEDLRRGSRQRTQPFILEPLEVVAGRSPPACCAPCAYFQRREGVDMQLRAGLLHRADDARIGLAGIAGVDAALQADLGRTLGDGLAGAVGDLFADRAYRACRGSRPCSTTWKRRRTSRRRCRCWCS